MAQLHSSIKATSLKTFITMTKQSKHNIIIIIIINLFLKQF